MTVRPTAGHGFFGAPRALRTLVLSAGVLIFGVASAAAQSCNEDIGEFQKKRNTHIEALNKMSKASKGKLDPIASCPRLRNLAAIEREMLAYMEKNQNWCSIPANIIEQVKGGAQKTGQVAGQACKIAAQARQMQQQGAQMQAGAPPPPALPRGPL